MRRGGGGTGGHRADEHPAPGGSGERLAVLSAPLPGNVDADRSVGRLRARRAGCSQPLRHDLVGVVEVVELRSAQHLRLFVESGVVAELQVVEVAEFPEFVEGNDVGDFVAARFWRR